jgi:PAS domain S-box-containing protein
VPPIATDMLPMVEEALDQSNGVLAVVERAAEAGGDLIVRQVNGAFCRAFGVEATALEGQSLAALTAPEEAAKLQALAQAAARGEAHRTELLCLRPAGTRLWLGLTLMPAGRPGERNRLFVMLARDITQQRHEAEQQNAVQRLLATVFSVAEAGLSIVGLDGRFLMTNAYHDRLFGYEPGSLAGKPTLGYLAPESRELVQRAREQQAGDQQRYSLEASVLAADGSAMPVSMTAALVSISDKERYRVVTVMPRQPAALKAALPLRVHLTGKIRLVSLEDVRTALGDRWDTMVERVMESAERIVARMMVQGDTYFRTKDFGFVVCFASSSEEEATFRAAAIAREIRHRLIGAGEDPEVVEVSAVITAVPASQIGESGNASLDRRLADVERQVRAEPNPPPGANGFVFERVIGREKGAVLGYFVRALWPPRGQGPGIAAMGPERSGADLAALRFAANLALERLGEGNEVLFAELDFDCFFNRKKTEALLSVCQNFTPAARERLVLLLSGISESVAQSRVLDSVQRLRPCVRAVGFVLEAPELPATQAIATVSTFVLLNAHVWERSRALAQARITRLAAGLHARKSSLVVRGVENPAGRELLRDCGVSLFAVAGN